MKFQVIKKKLIHLTELTNNFEGWIISECLFSEKTLGVVWKIDIKELMRFIYELLSLVAKTNLYSTLT